MDNIFTPNWERRLEAQFLANNKCRKRAYICSPLSAPTKQEFIWNMRTARAYMLYAMEKMNMDARAPHAYLPMLLCDAVPAERALALLFGQRLLEQSDLVLVCGNRLSKGMRSEIAYAASLNMPIMVFDEELYLEVRKIVTQHSGSKKTVCIDRDHFPMAMTEPTNYLEEL